MYGKVDYYYRREKINMKRLSEDLSAWLVKQGVITIEDIELYEYAVYSFLLLLVPVTIVFIYGIFTRNFLESVSVVVTVIAFRKYCGGYHAKYSWMCMIFSCGSIFLCLYLAERIKYSAYHSRICWVVFFAVNGKKKTINLYVSWNGTGGRITDNWRNYRGIYGKNKRHRFI